MHYTSRTSQGSSVTKPGSGAPAQFEANWGWLALDYDTGWSTDMYCDYPPVVFGYNQPQITVRTVCGAESSFLPTPTSEPTPLGGGTVTPEPTWTLTPSPTPSPTGTETPTPTRPAWITEINPQPIPTGTPCPDWNLRSGCGKDDAFVEVGVPSGMSLAGWQIRAEEGITETLQCQYEYRVDNQTWPLKVIWGDMFEDSAWEGVCSALPITGTIHLWNDSGDLIDSRPYTSTMTAGNSWAADDWDDPDETWSESTPSPGR